MKNNKNKTITLAGVDIDPGKHAIVKLPLADLYTQTDMSIPIHVFHGKSAGPKVFISSVIHGDEINSIEIIRRVHAQRWLKHINGTLITLPIINVYGFMLRSRYLPDRRDLNRSFPGSKTGSLASRLANTLTTEIFSKCQYGIDLHTGAYGRVNFPQLRVNLSTPGTKKLAKAFDVPVIIDAQLRDGSLRQVASEMNIPILVYEGGEALRFNELCIRMGVRGITKVLDYLGMIESPLSSKSTLFKPLITKHTRWVRACDSGMLQFCKDFTKKFTVTKGETLAYIHDPFQVNPPQKVKAPFNGIVIGLTNLPVVNEGDAVFNIASTTRLKMLDAYIDDMRDEITQFDS